MDQVKQVIIVRKDLKMRAGKIAAQASHASMQFLIKRLEYKDNLLSAKEYHGPLFSKEEHRWMEGNFRKVVLQVDSEQELVNLHKQALESGLISHLITDDGLTEFNGVPTRTCIAIGPDLDEKIDKLTSHLKLY